MKTLNVVYGLHAVQALLQNPLRIIKKIHVKESRQDERLKTLLTTAKERGIAVEYLTPTSMEKRFATMVHQGVVAYAEPLPTYDETNIASLLSQTKHPALILIIDGVTDPHNLGACLRTANAAGVDFVLIPKDKNAGLTEAVSKVACGAAETTPLVRVTNLVRAIEVLKKAGVWVYGAALGSSTSLYNLPLQDSCAIVMGAEDKGMRRLTKEHCDELFLLPLHGEVESLNVSVATGICLYEALRQRALKLTPHKE